MMKCRGGGWFPGVVFDVGKKTQREERGLCKEGEIHVFMCGNKKEK